MSLVHLVVTLVAVGVALRAINNSIAVDRTTRTARNVVVVPWLLRGFGVPGAIGRMDAGA